MSPPKNEQPLPQGHHEGNNDIVHLDPQEEEEEYDLNNPKDLTQFLSDFYDDTNEGVSFDIFLTDVFNIGTLEKYFNVLSNCDCCDRHQQRRPEALGHLPNYEQVHGGDHHKGECDCLCRAFTRMLCRAWVIMVPEENINPS